MENIFFTLFSVQSLIPAVTFIVIGWMLLSIPERSKATFHLALSLLLYSAVPLSYFFASSFYYPVAGYNRWVAAFIGIPSAFHAIMFFVYYPRPSNLQWLKWIVPIGWGFISVGWILFILTTVNAETVYLFSGHNYELNALKQQKVIAMAIPVIGFIFIIMGIYRSVTTKGREKILTMGIFFSYLVLTIFPAAGNILSREGIITRGLFMNLFDLITLIGLFFTIIIYINFTKERTSILIKIISVSMVVMLLVIQFIANITFNYIEDNYDRTKINEAIIELQNIKNPVKASYIQLKNQEKHAETHHLFENSSKRLYREDSKNKQHSFAYLIKNPQDGQMYEVGFDYVEYRKEMHHVTKPIIYIIIILMLVLVFGYRLFFYRALLQPIASLLDGLKEVEDGNLNPNLKMQVKDEIGIMTQSFNMMVRAIKASKLRMERYAGTLEKKVKKRTSELSKTLKDVNELKEKQDGDYFLTSLILKPLGPNAAQSDSVHTDFIVEQKKKFKFRKWESHIGGDICITDNLIFGGKPYVVFINGDAMGKSLQGASGAIVLGAAFRSVLERSKYSPEVQAITPERWLKNTFIELQNIFEGFDGSMLMSAVIGLVDEQTGFTYLINAEHPWSVLYRDGDANFFEKESMFRKLGSQLIAGNIYIKTFHMKKRDVLFFGSDGRDDILLREKTEDSEDKKLNEDETLFLSIIKKSGGVLSNIVEEIKNTGEVTDDLSILRVEYLGSEQEKPPCNEEEIVSKASGLLKDNKSDEAIKILTEANSICSITKPMAKLLLKIYINEKKYKESIDFAVEYVDKHPEDLNALFALSYSYKKTRQFFKAIDTGEKIRLRAPAMVENLVNLAESYFMAKNYMRAKKIAEEALSIKPDLPRSDKLIERIEIKMAEGSF